ncbi:MAG TPA: alkaline phosphatase family protein [Candidatus Tumulicola sp.]
MKLAEPRGKVSGKIKHVIIIVQENRSMDDLFQGFPGADTQSYGFTSTGAKVKLQSVPLEAPWDIDHSSTSFFEACNGTGQLPGTDCRNNGFDKEYVSCGSQCPYPHPMYGFVPRKEAQPYFDMASQYVIADRMFTSHLDASSFISHQYIIRANASSSVDFPSGIWGCDGGPSDMVNTINQQRQIGSPVQACYDSETLGDELDTAKISWGYYTAAINGDGNLWNAYQAISHIRYGKDWTTDVITPQTKFFDVVSSGQLPTVSWITPTCENSDHAGCGSNTGPAWVTSLVNAVGESKYWNSTAIFIMWDEYGGWYDHVKPKMVDYDGLGMRVPLLVISPYAKKGYVSHVQYEHGSILRFTEDQYGLPRIAAADARANSPEDDCFDFTQKPRKFVPIKASKSMAEILAQPPDRRVPDSE